MKQIILILFSLNLLFAGEKDENLMKAVKERKIDLVKSLLEQGATPWWKDERGITPLMEAIDLGYSEIAAEMLVRGVHYPESEGLYSSEITEQKSCAAWCRIIETAVRMHNMTCDFSEKIRFCFDENEREYIEILITEEIIEKIRRFLPFKKLPQCSCNGEYVIYPRRPDALQGALYPEIGVCCTYHGSPDIGHTDYRLRTMKPDDLRIKSWPTSLQWKTAE